MEERHRKACNPWEFEAGEKPSKSVSIAWGSRPGTRSRSPSSSAARFYHLLIVMENNVLPHYLFGMRDELVACPLIKKSGTAVPGRPRQESMFFKEVTIDRAKHGVHVFEQMCCLSAEVADKQRSKRFRARKAGNSKMMGFYAPFGLPLVVNGVAMTSQSSSSTRRTARWKTAAGIQGREG